MHVCRYYLPERSRKVNLGRIGFAVRLNNPGRIKHRVILNEYKLSGNDVASIDVRSVLAMYNSLMLGQRFFNSFSMAFDMEGFMISALSRKKVDTKVQS